MVGPEGSGTGTGWPAPPRVSPGPSAPPPLCRELWGPREAARYQGDSRGGLQRLVPPGACSHSGLRRAAAVRGVRGGRSWGRYSVSPDYLQYQCWDALQALCSTLTGALATRAVLQAVGVGDSAATVTGATLTWWDLVVDTGSPPTRRTRLDCEAKQWRTLECTGGILADTGRQWVTQVPLPQCIVGVAGGATRAALAVHQARRDNMADVAAKDSSQETLVNGAGLLLALLLLPLLEGEWPLGKGAGPLGCSGRELVLHGEAGLKERGWGLGFSRRGLVLHGEVGLKERGRGLAGGGGVWGWGSWASLRPPPGADGTL
uniref:Protein root UVB sensitive/RUS domain-containing protein n=1 Tax=Falco tinnunculus TaxID=100819 RepID=A0A8C4XMP0_FALTI